MYCYIGQLLFVIGKGTTDLLLNVHIFGTKSFLFYFGILIFTLHSMLPIIRFLLIQFLPFRHLLIFFCIDFCIDFHSYKIFEF